MLLRHTETRDANRDSEGPSDGRPGPDSRPAKKILLVDDEESLRFVLSRILKSRGYEVLTASGAVQALATSKRRGPFGLLLTDVRLPEITGLELAHRIRRSNPDAAVVTMSAHPKDLVKQSIYWRDQFGFVEKPFRTESLLAAVERAIAV